MIPKKNDLNIRTAKWFILIYLVAFLIFVIYMVFTAGCVTAAKNTYHGLTDTPLPTPEPTPEPTSEPTTAIPTPVPTIDLTELMLSTNGYHMRDWLHWYRQDVQGINGEGKKDLSTWVTVYGYKVLPQYHYHSVSWGTLSFFLEKPDDGMDYLFVFINMYSDGDDVRQHLFSRNSFTVGINGTTYYPTDIYNPNYQIKELDDTWDYAHKETVKPYGYNVYQDLRDGQIYATEQQWLMGGRSNAEDGYVIFEIPKNTDPKDIQVMGSFANLGGNAWWQLE